MEKDRQAGVHSSGYFDGSVPKKYSREAAEHDKKLAAIMASIFENNADRDDLTSGQRMALEVFREQMFLQLYQFASYFDHRELLDEDPEELMLRGYVESLMNPAEDGTLPPAAVEVANTFGFGSTSKADAGSYDKKVGARLAKARDICKMSVYEASKELNISSQALYKYEKGERTIKAKLVYDAALLYQVDANWLMCITDVLRVSRRDNDGYLVTTTYREPSSERRGVKR